MNNEDILYDLGCGDGRILFAVVSEFGAKKAVGYELRKEIYEQTLVEIRRRGLESRVFVLNEDLMKGDFREATVITLYLTTAGNEVLRQKLEREAKTGTRIISHDFNFNGWTLTSKEYYTGHTLYLYTLPKGLFKHQVN